MQYSSESLKIDQIVSFVNEGKINLIPVFQRGSVWKLPMRRALINNILKGRPIPAVFLYKEPKESDSGYLYNILDGKQRIETLMLFVGNKHADLKINDLPAHFFKNEAINDRDFDVAVTDDDGTDRSLGFKDLERPVVRELREYKIPVVEITLEDDGSGLANVIELFVSINTQGEKVSRIAIIKAMKKDELFNSLLPLLAIREQRKKTVYYNVKDTPYSRVLKKLNSVRRLTEPNVKVDAMWERLTEIALFIRTNKHKAPATILRDMTTGKAQNAALSKDEQRRLKVVFAFLGDLYRQKAFGESKIAKDQPHFYTLVTALLVEPALMSIPLSERIAKLNVFRGLVESDQPHTGDMKKYLDLYLKQTTHPGRRENRQDLFVKIVRSL